MELALWHKIFKSDIEVLQILVCFFRAVAIKGMTGIRIKITNITLRIGL